MIPTISVRKKSNCGLTISIIAGIVIGITAAALIVCKLCSKKSKNKKTHSKNDNCECVDLFENCPPEADTNCFCSTEDPNN